MAARSKGQPMTDEIRVTMTPLPKHAKTRTLPAGRMCHHCEGKLSKYNQGLVCFACEAKRLPEPLGLCWSCQQPIDEPEQQPMRVPGRRPQYHEACRPRVVAS